MYCVELLQYVVRMKTAVRGVHSEGGDMGAQPPPGPVKSKDFTGFSGTNDFRFNGSFFNMENFPIWPIKHIFLSFLFYIFFVGMLYKQNKKVEKLLNYRQTNAWILKKETEFISPWLIQGEWGCIGCRDYGNKMNAYLS